MSKIVTVTANPAIDVSTAVDVVEPVRKLRCADARRDPGGGGINVARIVKRLGGEAVAIYPVGGPTGELLRRLVAREAVESIAIPIAGDTREDFTVLEQKTGREFRFVLPGPALAAKERDALIAAIEDAESRPKYVVLSGSLPPHVPETFYADAVRAAKATGARVVVDTSGPALKAALGEGVYIVKPNLREFRELMGAALAEDRQLVGAARTLCISGRAEFVALTLGEMGAFLVTRDKAWRGRAPKMVPLSTVGAGDSFLGALVASLATGAGIADALRYGIAAGTAALLSQGTELCRREDVERLLPSITIEELSGTLA